MGDLQPLIGHPYFMGPINPCYWVDDHPLLYGNNGSLDLSTYEQALLHSHPLGNTSQHPMSRYLQGYVSDIQEIFLVMVTGSPL